MAIIIKQGDADTLTETITGLSSLAGYSGKMYIYRGSVLLATLTGVVSGLTVVYTITNEVSKLWAVGNYNYETKIYDTADHVYTCSTGEFIVTSTIEEDPS
jgi:rRNA maturation endonuclease Nob1